VNVTRRGFLKTGLMGGGSLAAALMLPSGARAQKAAPSSVNDVAVIRMTSNAEGSVVRFDPGGLLIRPGQTVRWECVENVHTTAAYHPDNDRHSLRIPEGAKPWNSDYLMPGETFEVTLTVEGVYDYFCAPHEMAGMVGRIVVARPGGPGARPFDYFRNDRAKRDWQEVPKAARDAFPDIDEIMKNGRV
jgi:plastocyanin